MQLSEKQKKFYEEKSKWKLTHENMSLTDLCALIEYHTQLRCLIEADLDTPFDYDELRCLLEDYGYTLSEDDNKILDEALIITNKLINDLQTDINAYRKISNKDKFKYELLVYDIYISDIIDLYDKIVNHKDKDIAMNIIGEYTTSNMFGETYMGGYTLWVDGIIMYEDELNLTDTDKNIINIAKKHNVESISVSISELENRW